MKINILGCVFLLSSVSYGLSMQEKAGRLEQVEKLHRVIPNTDIDSYRRGFMYEQKQLPLAVRIKNEAQFTAEKMKNSLITQFEAATKNLGSKDKAAREIEMSLENDLKFADPQLREDLKSFALSTLSDIKKGEIKNENSVRLEKVVASRVRGQMEYFNNASANSLSSQQGKKSTPIQKLNYRNRAELAQELVNGGLSAPYDSSASIGAESADTVVRKADISLQINIEFMGSSINAGPTISFSRKITTKASLKAEGTDPFLRTDGTFDTFARRNGQPIVKNGVQQRRNIIFNCTATLSFETEYGGSGGFKIAGSGASVETKHNVSQEVSIRGRQISLPDTVAGKFVTMSILRDTCNNEFLTVENSNGISTTASLDEMLTSFARSLVLINPRTKCTLDTHCYNWWNNLGMVRVNTEPRCILDQSGEFASCELRGAKGYACALYDANGKHISDDMFERPCDAGLSCVQVSAGGWFQEGIFGRVWSAPKGACQ